ncbi:hypothetical protein [Streptomyces sp. WAC 06738]|uniref:hypothetical protein n=1 Tax=Streptomyces sp. WAC 06738 TaxID=2203210 RepID=UPI000F7A5A5D|nr:hypothetical protein [Streptomyces sp. WAC 06738]
MWAIVYRKPAIAFLGAVQEERAKRQQAQAAALAARRCGEAALSIAARLTAAQSEAEVQASLPEAERAFRRLEALTNFATRAAADVATASAIVDQMQRRLPHRRILARLGGRPDATLADGLITLALLLGGSRAAGLQDAWRADLVDVPEEGTVLGRGERLHHALGIVVAAVKLRLHGFAGTWWRPVDWVLSTQERTNTLIALAVGAHIIYLSHTAGLGQVIAVDWQSPVGLAAGLVWLSSWLKKRRGIELADIDDDQP